MEARDEGDGGVVERLLNTSFPVKVIPSKIPKDAATKMCLLCEVNGHKSR